MQLIAELLICAAILIRKLFDTYLIMAYASVILSFLVLIAAPYDHSILVAKKSGMIVDSVAVQHHDSVFYYKYLRSKKSTDSGYIFGAHDSTYTRLSNTYKHGVEVFDYNQNINPTPLVRNTHSGKISYTMGVEFTRLRLIGDTIVEYTDTIQMVSK